MTDEQLVAYLDAAHHRLGDEAEARFADSIEALRAGTIFAHDAKQYGRWRSRRRTGATPGKDLAALARDFGGNVTAGGFEFRH